MRIWTVRTLAEKAGTSIRWVHDEIIRGKFPGIEKVGNTYAIPYEEGVEWLKARGVEVIEEEQVKK